MSRKEQIEKANPYRDFDNTPDNCHGCKEAHYHDGFIEGAEWADSHANAIWHKYPDEQPTEGKCYLLALENKKQLVATYIGETLTKDGCRFKINDCSYAYNVIAWMELPDFPNFD